MPEQNVEVEGVEVEPDLKYPEYPIRVQDQKKPCHTKEDNQVLQDTMESTFQRRSYMEIQRFLARTVSRISCVNIE